MSYDREVQNFHVAFLEIPRTTFRRRQEESKIEEGNLDGLDNYIHIPETYVMYSCFCLILNGYTLLRSKWLHVRRKMGLQHSDVLWRELVS